MNKRECTITYSLSFCRNNLMYVFKDTEISFENYLLVERSSNWDDIDISIISNGDNKGTINYINDNGDILSTNDIKGAYRINYHINQRFTTDTFSFELLAKERKYSSDELSFDTCTATIVVCGTGCSKCDTEDNL